MSRLAEHDLFEHTDHLGALNENRPLGEKIAAVHAVVRQRHPGIDRLAVATYDPESDMLHTFVASGEQNPLIRYQSRLSDAPSLREILREKRPRVVNDLSIFAAGEHEHTRRIAGEGFASSYTVPIFHNTEFWGFIFFNSKERAIFRKEVVEDLTVFAHLIAALVAHEMATVRMLLGAIRTANDLVHARDPETHAHLRRMARYARIIATDMAATGNYPELSDETIERLFWFAPMHDIGKLGIPDDILKKPARLDEDEIALMQRHSELGVEMLNRIIENFHLNAFHGIDLLREVASMHHETLDGKGYPQGLAGDEIPLPARIVAVADIFDALTSRRPYKRAWSNDEAFETLLEMSRAKIDRECVDALMRNRDTIREIQRAFLDEE